MWWFAVVFVAALVIGLAMSPKAQTAPPPGISEVKAPTAEEGREIPVLFGTRDIEGPNVVMFGDVKVVAIREKGGKK